MTSKKRNSQRGMTLMEVLTASVILSLLVLPIASYFTMAAGARADSQAVTKATIYAENLLGDIKEQIEEDVEVQRAEENNPRFNSSNDIVERTEDDGLRDYVRKDINIEQSHLRPEFQFKLNEYLYKTEAKFNAEYETERYAYEAAVWRIDQKTIEHININGKLNWAEDSIDRAILLYNNDEYDLTGIDADAAKMTLPPALLKDSFITKDQYFEGKVERDSRPNYSAIITVDEEGIPTPTSIESIIDLSQVKRHPVREVRGQRVYKLKVGGTGKRTILIDATKVHDGLPRDALTIEIENDGSGQLVVQVRKSIDEVPEGGSFKTGLTKTEALDVRLRLLPTKNQDIVIERPKDIEVEDVYLIALIVRDLSPANGKPGKIVKKMIEVYSYDYPNM